MDDDPWARHKGLHSGRHCWDSSSDWDDQQGHSIPHDLVRNIVVKLSVDWQAMVTARGMSAERVQQERRTPEENPYMQNYHQFDQNHAHNSCEE